MIFQLRFSWVHLTLRIWTRWCKPMMTSLFIHDTCRKSLLSCWLLQGTKNWFILNHRCTLELPLQITVLHLVELFDWEFYRQQHIYLSLGWVQCRISLTFWEITSKRWEISKSISQSAHTTVLQYCSVGSSQLNHLVATRAAWEDLVQLPQPLVHDYYRYSLTYSFLFFF